ncbi:WGR domain-containing protein [Aquimonas sp.]|jgi:bifunctional non-homologous end joining protein LigD|uniref:ATP-dependent DNA ligase n=1 Tax=Aquimonas sp. TaxID=1872588 RepID=UPI0037C0F825
MQESITLFFREGASDKQYQAQLLQDGDQWRVEFQYGRRGSALTSGSKTVTPVPYAQAKRIYDKLVAEKQGKGYTPMEGGAAYTGTEHAGRASGYRPQLLNPVENAPELESLLSDPTWGLQEKYDGERRLVVIEGDVVVGTNRKGLTVALPASIEQAVRTKIHARGVTVIDGEQVGESYLPFDLLVCHGVDLRDRPYAERLDALEALILNIPGWPRPLTYSTYEQKRRVLDELRADRREGVVFKRMDAPYTPDRPNSGGAQRKYKFVESATCRVRAVNVGKRSVQLELHDPSTGAWTYVGNVSIPANRVVPEIGELAEVAYLYAFSGGSLFQPVYLGPRLDLVPEDCSVAQLKFKRESEAA